MSGRGLFFSGVVAYDTRDVGLPYYRGVVVMSVLYPRGSIRSLFLFVCIQWPYLYVHYLGYGSWGYDSGFSFKKAVIYSNEIA